MRSNRLILALAALAALWLGGAGPVLAAADAGHGEAADKPSVIDLRKEMGIWTVVVFGSLLFILSRTAWPAILEGLKKREEALVAARDEAAKLREEAQKIRDQLAQEMARANDTVRELLDEARRDAAKYKEDEVARTQAEIAANRERLLREVETAKNQALQAITQQSVELAALISTKAVRRELTPSDHSRLVDEALAELNAELADGRAAAGAKA